METFNELTIKLDKSEKILKFLGLTYTNKKDGTEINLLIINNKYKYVCNYSIFESIEDIVENIMYSGEASISIIENPDDYKKEFKLIEYVRSKLPYQLNEFIEIDPDSYASVYSCEYIFFETDEDDIYDSFLNHEQFYYLMNFNKQCGVTNSGCDYNCMSCEIPTSEPKECPDCTDFEKSHAYYEDKKWYCSHCNELLE